MSWWLQRFRLVPVRQRLVVSIMVGRNSHTTLDTRSLRERKPSFATTAVVAPIKEREAPKKIEVQKSFTCAYPRFCCDTVAQLKNMTAPTKEG